MNMENIEKIVKEYESYAEKKASAMDTLTRKLAIEKEQLNPEYFERYSKQLKTAHDNTYRPEFDALGKRLNQELDDIRDEIQAGIDAARPENYDLKLSNMLTMLATLDGSGISQNMKAITEAARPFSYDPIARAAISKLLTNQDIMPMGLFDDEAPHTLGLLETARDFTAEKAYGDQSIGHNMRDFFSRNFDGIEQGDYFGGAVQPVGQPAGGFVNPFVPTSSR